MELNSELEKIIRMRNDADFYASESKKKLQEKIEKQMTSIMVGSLNAIELEMGFLWGHNERETSEVQESIKQLYEKVRGAIFDKGNSEIKKMRTEMDKYDVGCHQGSVTLPVLKQNETVSEANKRVGNDE